MEMERNEEKVSAAKGVEMNEWREKEMKWNESKLRLSKGMESR